VLPPDLPSRPKVRGVDDHARADEPIDRDLVKAQPVLLEVVRRVDMRTRLRAQMDREQVEALVLDGAVHLEAWCRVARVDDGVGVHGD
jgi:hypothetical protein